MDLLVLMLLAAVVPAFLAPRWAALGYGIFWLLAGLLWLDQHVQPSAEDGDRLGLGSLVFTACLAVGLVGSLIVAVRRARAPADDRPALWPLPLGLLLAVFALHWLSNRLAGATPAWAVHVGVIAVAAAAALGCWRWQRTARAGCLRDLIRLAAVAGLALALLAGKAGIDAFRWRATAQTAADGARYCLLTYAGRDHPRSARHVLELSPLVSRSGGRSFVEDAAWIVVAGPDGPVALRRVTPWGRRPYFERTSLTRAACTPRIDGALDD